MEPKSWWFVYRFWFFQGACFRFHVRFFGGCKLPSCSRRKAAPLEEGRGSVHSDHFACRPPFLPPKKSSGDVWQKHLIFFTTSSFFVYKAMPVENRGFKTVDTILYLDLPGRVCFSLLWKMLVSSTHWTLLVVQVHFNLRVSTTSSGRFRWLTSICSKTLQHGSAWHVFQHKFGHPRKHHLDSHVTHVWNLPFFGLFLAKHLDFPFCPSPHIHPKIQKKTSPKTHLKTSRTSRGTWSEVVRGRESLRIHTPP